MVVRFDNEMSRRATIVGRGSAPAHAPHLTDTRRTNEIGPVSAAKPPAAASNPNVAPAEAWIGSAPTPEIALLNKVWDTIPDDDGFDAARGIVAAVSIGAVLLVGGFIVGMMLLP